VNARAADQIGDLLPRVLPGYRLGPRIGGDSISEWYDAEQASLGRPVTVRLLKPGLTTNHAARAAFREEMDRLLLLDHPNLIRILDARRDPDLALVTERMGRTLADDLEERRALGDAFALRAARDVLRGLLHLFENDLAHRNVCPGTVVVADEECRLVTLKGVIPLAELALLRGRLYQDARYVAPEQLAGDAPIGPPTASYQVAALLFHMVTGRPPHDGVSPAATARAHLNGGFPPLERIRPFPTPGLAELIRSASERDPALRPSPEDMLAQVERLIPRASRGASPRSRRRRRRARRRR